MRILPFALLLASLASLSPAALAVESISAKDAAARVQAGKAVLVDVREESELRDGKAAPAVWLPTSEIRTHGPKYTALMTTLDKKKDVIVYCASGARAGKFAKELEGQGYKAENMGGFSEWKDAGLPVSKP